MDKEYLRAKGRLAMVIILGSDHTLLSDLLNSHHSRVRNLRCRTRSSSHHRHSLLHHLHEILRNRRRRRRCNHHRRKT